MYYYIVPEKLHTHVGYGIDDPLDRDLAPGQPVRNDTIFTNLIWDVSKYIRVAEEFTYRKTAYTVVPNNQGFGFQTQVQFKFLSRDPAGAFIEEVITSAACRGSERAGRDRRMLLQALLELRHDLHGRPGGPRSAEVPSPDIPPSGR